MFDYASFAERFKNFNKRLDNGGSIDNIEIHGSLRKILIKAIMDDPNIIETIEYRAADALMKHADERITNSLRFFEVREWMKVLKNRRGKMKKAEFVM